MFKVIVVDPPWDQRKTGKRRSHPNQESNLLPYSTMSKEEIMNLPVDKIADEKNSFLWLWVTNSKDFKTKKPIMQQGFEIMEKWGFKYYTIVTWNKKTGVCPFGPYQITTEHVLFGYKGTANFPHNSWGKLQTSFESTVKRKKVNENHSNKPDVFYQSIVEYFPGPRIDLFARKEKNGFFGWGNEYEGTAKFDLSSFGFK